MKESLLKLLEPQFYPGVVATILPAIIFLPVKDIYGFVPSLITALITCLTGMGIGQATVNKSPSVKWATIVGTFLVGIAAMLIIAESASPAEAAQQSEATE
ncbi:hypothetical protein GCM10023186_23890 [Hymenobacter koreensis]|uniref:Uncharacterized protein n=1 Tax=Hymenobacter koreensis TaxID=1084523 RepID=A0ABP8J180_9BACT